MMENYVLEHAIKIPLKQRISLKNDWRILATYSRYIG